MWSFLSHAKQLLKCNAQNAFFLFQGIVYSTCGHLLRENQSSRGILRWTLDLLSIPNYVIKKGDLMAIADHFIAHNLRRRCRKRGFEGSHDCFLKDEVFRDSTRN